jgi:ATP-binding protein involved in chromosome partitioning
MTPDERSALTTKLRGGRPEAERSIQLDPRTRVIAVASGKGGVGKSTLTANLAAALSQLGHQVGILDADIYGHSIPHMLGIQQKPVLVDKLMIPPVAHDLKLMSIGFFLDDNGPLMWRGPMLHRALEQFLQDVHWGELDVLVVDMPPGTGDVSISLGQLLPRAEALVVTTPQVLAQEVASRAGEMARKTGMQLLGVVENMTSEVFGSGGGARLAAELGVKLLGSVPLDARLRESADGGLPLVLSDPDCEPAQAIVEIAASLDRTRGAGFTRTLPLVS